MKRKPITFLLLLALAGTCALVYYDPLGWELLPNGEQPDDRPPRAHSHVEDDGREIPPAEEEPEDPPEIFRVNDLREFLAALGNDRIIELESDIDIRSGLQRLELDYDKLIMDPPESDHQYSAAYTEAHYSISTYRDKEEDKDYFVRNRWENFRNETGLLFSVRNCRNLCIRSAGKRKEITIEDHYTSVLDFRNVDGLLLENLRLYHVLKPYEDCEIAPVISFRNCGTVHVKDSDLNGSGTEGIDAEKVDSILVKNCRIYNCTYSSFDAVDVGYISLDSCAITDNKFYELFLRLRSKVSITNSTIARNRPRYGSAFFREPWVSDSLIIANCVIEDNRGFAITPGMENYLEANNRLRKNDLRLASMLSDLVMPPDTFSDRILLDGLPPDSVWIEVDMHKQKSPQVSGFYDHLNDTTVGRREMEIDTRAWEAGEYRLILKNAIDYRSKRMYKK